MMQGTSMTTSASRGAWLGGRSGNCRHQRSFSYWCRFAVISVVLGAPLSHLSVEVQSFSTRLPLASSSCTAACGPTTTASAAAIEGAWLHPLERWDPLDWCRGGSGALPSKRDASVPSKVAAVRQGTRVLLGPLLSSATDRGGGLAGEDTDDTDSRTEEEEDRSDEMDERGEGEGSREEVGGGATSPTAALPIVNLKCGGCCRRLGKREAATRLARSSGVLSLVDFCLFRLLLLLLVEKGNRPRGVSRRILAAAWLGGAPPAGCESTRRPPLHCAPPAGWRRTADTRLPEPL
eukprot:GHVU01227657.1.p1 GENE.GHVU01227657.1~~GHVU01227657.1.p1  ORF type:complete len:292 (+),score=38.48 GHVU01227657.1:481-1356(+)